MATRDEYVQMSGRVYSRTRPNSMFVPDGWTEQIWLRDTAITGFAAGVYRSGNEIVIAFTGTNASKLADTLFANIPAWLGISSPQVAQAAALVMDVMHANPGAEISFTGHSLGGGLASVMAVLFDKQASVFDPAPFERTVRNPARRGCP